MARKEFFPEVTKKVIILFPFLFLFRLLLLTLFRN